jgi:hypothetical protein
MKIKVLLATSDGFRRLYSISESTGGLYVHESGSSGDHFSYHNDGTCFYHSFGNRTMKKVRDPIIGFTGIETLRVSAILINSGEPEKTYTRSANDIVLRHTAPFWLDMAISDSENSWTPSEGHLNSEFFVRKISYLWFLFEAYSKADAVMEQFKFKKYEWEVGKNLFFLANQDKIST